MKKKISLFLSLALLVSSFVSINVQAAQVSFADVTAETKYQAAIVSLAKMRLINGYEEEGVSNFKPENQITRAEFTAIITRAMGVGDIDSGTSAFPDAQEHWARGNIQVAYDRKIVNGFEDGTFRPDENVTYEQAVKMIVCTLGYETTAQSLGGWPNGYITQAGKLGVTSGISGVVNAEPAARGVVAQLVYNALEADVLNVSTSDSEGKNETFMEKYLNMRKEKGLVVGVDTEVTAQCPQKLGVNQMAAIVNNQVIYLDWTQYTSNKADISKYLGQTVMLFYQYDIVGSDDILIDIGAEATKNTITEINSDDLISYSGGKISYYDANDKTQSVKIDTENLSVIYNNALVNNNIESKLAAWCQEDGVNQIYGTIKLTDSGSTGAANLVEIMDYDILVASKAPTSSDYKITNKYKLSGEEDKSIILDPKGDIEYTITYEGTSIETTSIRANDVVLVALSEDGEKCNVLVSRNVVKGKITAYYEDDKKVTISGKDYILHDRFLEYANQQEFRNNIKVEAEVEFYTDAFGNVVFGEVKSSQTVSPYAYVINAGEDEDGDGYFIRVYLPSTNKTATYTLKDKVSYNGGSKSASEAVAALRNSVETPGDSEGEATSYSQIARVTVSNNLVTTIVTDTAKEENAGTTVSDSSALSMYKAYTDNVEYKGSNNFNNEFYINSSTTVIKVPLDRSESESYSNTKSFNTGSKYDIIVYNVNSSKVADLVLVFNTKTTGTTVGAGTTMFVAAKKGTTEVTADGDTLYKLPYYPSTATLTEKLVGEAESSKYEALVPGDIFRSGTDKDSYLGNFEKVILSFNDIKDVFETGVAGENDTIFDWTASKFQFEHDYKNHNNSTHDSCTEVYMYNVLEVDVDGKLMRVTSSGFVKGEDGYDISADAEEFRYSIPDSCVILRYDSDKKEVSPYVKDTETKMTLEDISGGEDIMGTECSKLAIYEYNGTVKMIVVYDEVKNLF